MSKQANKTLIGSFVLGAVVLIIAGVLIFGSGQIFVRLDKHVLYFKGSVKGLNVGAPVMFRGVKIGSVSDILLQFDTDDLSIRIPVVIEIDPESFTRIDDVKTWGAVNYLELLIKNGLRAQLQMQSVVTGQLIVDLDFYPDKPERFVGGESKYPEIPTIPTDLEELARKIGNLPFEELFGKLVKAIEGIERIVNSPELIGSLGSLDKALIDIRSLLVNIDKQFIPLTTSLRETSDAAQSAFVQAEKTLSAFQGVTAEDSEMIYELNTALKELSAAARSIRFMADYIERHPEALIRGKRDSKGE